MDDAVFRRLESFVSQARVILFTGAGFSRGARNPDGVALPTAEELTAELWEVAFPGEGYDGSGLQDVYEAALLQAKRKTTELLRRRCSVDAASLPTYYERWFSLPWHRIYTLNIDDLADVVDRTCELPRRLRPLSALAEAAPADVDGVSVVHLNGWLDDLPDVTFGGRQYAQRLASNDLWYTTVAQELISHPILFVGTTLDEPPLWQYVEARGARVARARELRPGSILVSPSLSKARAVSLRQHQIDWIEGTAESFEADVLRGLEQASAEGLELVRRSAERQERALLDLAARVDDAAGDEQEFLRGREPRWSDITDGFAVERESDAGVLKRVTDDELKLVIFTGTAGSGKSTSAMRLVLSLRASGGRVLELNEEADLRAHVLRRAVEAEPIDILFIPNLDRLGRSAQGVLEDLRQSKPNLVVVTSVRSPWYQRHGMPTYVDGRTDALEAVVPLLGDADIDGLLDALKRANRLGELKAKPIAEQRDVMTRKCGRQLLVAMIEATSGERFNAKIESECRELGPDAALVYGVVALATNFRVRMDNTGVLAAVGGDPIQGMTTINELERTHLLVRRDGALRLRHGLIAERCIEFFGSARMIETPLRGLAFSLAAATAPGRLRDTAVGRALIRLINHKRLIGFLRTPDERDPDLPGIRGVYEEVEDLLSHDHHYWLQRGSFETEVGDLDLAKNFIDQARALASEDPFVRAQWAYMTLKRAWRSPDDPGAEKRMTDALGELEEQIASRGRRDFYPFHIYGSQVLAWVKRAPLSPDQKRQLLQGSRDVVAEGLRLHPGNRDLGQLSRDLETAYLSTAVDET